MLMPKRMGGRMAPCASLIIYELCLEELHVLWLTVLIKWSQFEEIVHGRSINFECYQLTAVEETPEGPQFL